MTQLRLEPFALADLRWDPMSAIGIDCDEPAQGTSPRVPCIIAPMSRITSERLTGAIFGLGFVGILLTAWLVFSEIFREPTCPPLLGIPACYLVLAGYVAATIGTWMSGKKIAAVSFYVGAWAVTLIGVYFSLGHVRGTVECPTFEGLPMCYVSLLAGATMLVLDQARRRLPTSADIKSS